MARRRRRGYGEVKHRSRAVARAAIRSASRGWAGDHRKVPVIVHISRSVHAQWQGGRNGRNMARGMFEARACINTRTMKQWVGQRGMSQQRCGGLGVGTTPTKALVSALHKFKARS